MLPNLFDSLHSGLPSRSLDATDYRRSHIDNLDPCTSADLQDFASDSRESLKQAQNLSSVFYVVLLVDWGPRSNFHSFLSMLTALSSPGPTSRVC